MHRVAAHLAEPADGGLAGAHGADRLAMAFLPAQFYHRAKTFDRAGDEIERCLFRDQLAALVVIGIRQQRRDRDFGEVGIAIKLLAVGKGELGAFDLQMNELRACGIEAVEFESLQQRELLQHHGTLAPDAGFADGVTAIVISERRFDAGLPARHVVGAEHAAMRRSGDIHDVLRAAELIDRLGHKTTGPRLARTFDLRHPVGAGAFRFLQDADSVFGLALLKQQPALEGLNDGGDIV